MRTSNRNLLTAGAGLVLLGAAVLVTRSGAPLIGWVRLTAYVTAGAGVAVALAALAVRAGRPPGSWRLPVLALAIVVRVVLFPAPHELSEDAARYHWDGKVLVHGINPYIHVPDAPELDHLRGDAPDERISPRSRRTLTVYPPVAQALFAAAYAATPGSLLGLKLLWLLAEFASWLLLAAELARRNVSGTRLLLLAWCPLLVFTGYLPGHLDMLLLPFVLLFVRALDLGQAWRAGIYLALACLVKPFPAILVPAAWATLGTRRFARTATAIAAIGVLSYLPFIEAGEKLASSTILMGREWSFNGSVGALLEAIMPMETAHLVAAALMLAAATAGARLGRDALGRCLLAAGAFVVLSPTIFPWYLFWIVPLVALRPDPALIALVVLIPLTDLVVVGYAKEAVWEQPEWTRILEYAVFYPLLAVGAFRGWGMFRR